MVVIRTAKKDSAQVVEAQRKVSQRPPVPTPREPLRGSRAEGRTPPL